MISKSDWDAAGDEWIADARHRLTPPTAEEVQAFHEGELSEAEAARIGELLIYFPEAADVSPEAQESESQAIVSDEELTRDWESLRERLASASPARWRTVAMAASIAAVILGGLLWRTSRNERRLEHELREPRVNLPTLILLPGGRRGPASIPEAPRNASELVLRVSLIEPRPFSQYRLTIDAIDGDASQRLWSVDGIPHPGGETFNIHVSRRLLRPGIHRLTIEGLEPLKAPELVATYFFRISGPTN